MIYRPNFLAFADVFIVFLNILIFYFVYRMEKLECVEVEESWRHNFLRVYTVINVLVTLLLMTVSVSKSGLMMYYNIRPLAHLFLVYVLYTYTYELKCKLQGDDIFVMEFLKLYAMVRIFMVILVIILMTSTLFSLMPRYQSIMNMLLGLKRKEYLKTHKSSKKRRGGKK